MQGMAPFHLMTVLESQEIDRNPAVHEEGIDDEVQPRFGRYFDLQQHDDRYEILPDAENRPYLDGNELIQYIRVQGNIGIDHGNARINRRHHHEKRLRQGDDAVEHADIPRFDASGKELGNEPLAAVALSLGPAFALPAGLHETQGLFVINDGIVGPAGAHPFEEDLHGKFHIFCQAVTSPAIFTDNIGGDAHTRTAQSRRKADIVLGQMPHVVDEPESNGKRPGNPRVRRILGIHISLDDLFALAEMIVHFPQKFRMDQIIGIKDDEGVILFFLGQHLGKHPVHGIALADVFLIGAHADKGPVGPANVGGLIGAVIGHDVDIVHVLRIIQFLQIVDEVAHDPFFIMGADDRRKGMFWRHHDPVSLFHKAEAGQDKIV